MVRGHQASDGEWLAQQIVEAFPWDTAPRYLIRDNDGAYGQAFTNRVSMAVLAKLDAAFGTER